MVWITKDFDVLVNVLEPFLAVHTVDLQRNLNFLIQKNENLQQILEFLSVFVYNKTNRNVIFI